MSMRGWEGRPGATIGRWTLVRPLGRGGQGTAWLVRDPDGATSALKYLSPDCGAEARRRFAQEARILMDLEHDAVVRAHEVLGHRGALFLRMDVAPGESLHTLLVRRARAANPWRASEIACVMRRIVSAVAAFHRRGCVHRDLKPSNIMVDAQPEAGGRVRVTVLDFGVARLAEIDRSMQTTVGRWVGTPTYSAPEQWLGQDIGPPADLFAMGVLIYELVTGRRAWNRDLANEAQSLAHSRGHEDRGEIMGRIIRREFIPAARYADGAEPIDAFLERALAPRPKDRYASAGALLDALELALARCGNLAWIPPMGTRPPVDFDRSEVAPWDEETEPLWIDVDTSFGAEPEPLSGPVTLSE